jgi:cation transport ATPase
VTNAGGPIDLRMTATAAESTYAGIVRLLHEAEAAQPPSSGWPTDVLLIS